jgi:hydrogenase maturation protease
MAPSRPLVIGIGNPLRGDDGVGHEVVRRVRALGAVDADWLTVHQLLPELAERLGATDLVVFVDASASSPPGRVVTRRLDPAARSRELRAETLLIGHAFPPEQLVALAAALYGREPAAWVVGIGAGAFELDAGLSAAVRAAVDEAAAEVGRLLRRG